MHSNDLTLDTNLVRTAFRVHTAKAIITMNSKDNNQYHAAFFIVPTYITQLPDITWSFIKVYEAIFQFWNHKKPCYLSDEALMDKAQVGRTQLYEAFSYFEKNNELIRRRKGARRFFVQPEKWIEEACTEIVPTSAPPEVDIRSTGLSTSGGAEHNKKNINKELNKPFVDFEKSPSYRDDDLFMQFYSIYPNKQKPEVARKAFYKHKPDQEFVSMLRTDVNKRVENNWKNRHKNKIPHPSTYLNGKEWEGEIYPPESNVTNLPVKPPRYTMDELTGAL